MIGFICVSPFAVAKIAVITEVANRQLHGKLCAVLHNVKRLRGSFLLLIISLRDRSRAFEGGSKTKQ
jgi:hypothetical protein